MHNYFEFLRPHPALREYVRLYHVFRLGIRGSESDAAVKSVWPSRYCWLAFNPMNNSFVDSPTSGLVRLEPRTALIGHSTRITRKWYAGSDWFRFQVQLQPGALFRLTGIPNTALTDTEVDADAVLPPGMRNVSERLAEAVSLDQMTSVVESFLLRWIERGARRRLPLDRAIDLMAHDPSIISLDKAAAVACLSARQFHRKFVERMGVGPKTYLRVVRLTRAFGCKARCPEQTWTDISQAAGYSDYQHMAKDFKLMTLHLPPQAFARECQSPEARFAFSSERIW